MATLATGLASINYCYHDEVRPERFSFVIGSGWRDKIAAPRRADPLSSFPSVVNVEVRLDEVMIWPAPYNKNLQDVSRRLLQWMINAYDCNIANNVGTDMLKSND